MVDLRNLVILLLPVVALVGLVLILLLLRFARAERKSVAIVGLLFLISGGLLVPSASLVMGSRPDPEWLEKAAILLLGLTLISLLCRGLFRLLLPRFGIRPPRIHQDILVSLGVLIWTFFWLSRNGTDLASLVATSAVITAVVAFSLQDTLGNLLGGVAIQLDRSVRVGDWVQVGDSAGKVQEVRWRYTSIETRNWETLVVPNSTLVKNTFLVLGRRHGEPVQWRRWIRFNIDFRYSPADVIQAVEKSILAAEIPRVSPTPAPNCIVMGFDDSFARYAVRYWLTDLAADDPTDSQMRTNIYFGLKRAGIPLSIPAQALFLTEESQSRTQTKSEKELEKRVAALRQVDLFRKLGEEELIDTAAKLIPAPFAAEDIMTRAGSQAHWLYIIVAGIADVVVIEPNGNRVKVGELAAGQCFGEIALLTGEKRSSSVIARTPMQCFRLNREAFLSVLRVNKELEEEITSLIRERSSGLEEANQELDEKVRKQKMAQAHVAVRERIHRFFKGS